jgi:hypothetical protein
MEGGVPVGERFGKSKLFTYLPTNCTKTILTTFGINYSG